MDRTEGISSSEIRTEQRKVQLGLIGESVVIDKVAKECEFVNGLEISGICTSNKELSIKYEKKSFEALLDISDALYIISEPSLHYEQIKTALKQGKHILCESPIALKEAQSKELHEMALKNRCILMDSIKTAYATAYSRMLLLVKSGRIGEVISVEATATSLRDIEKINKKQINATWNSICAWGPTVLLPVFQLLGIEYHQKRIASKLIDESFDLFTQIDFLYKNSVATIKVGKGVKSEGELIISGTKGYVYIPAPWWKTDYFEIRYEDQNNNKRYFYQLDGEGIRYELVAFLRAIQTKRNTSFINQDVSDAICKVIEDFYCKKDMVELQ